MKYQAKSWWEHLEEKERELLIELLYDLNLQEYMIYDEDGNITGRLM